MKTLRHYNHLLLATCYLLLAPAMVLAGQGNWNIVDGGKTVNGEYQIKCGEGSGWQKCGEEESLCEYDNPSGFIPKKGAIISITDYSSYCGYAIRFPDSYPFEKCSGSLQGYYSESSSFRILNKNWGSKHIKTVRGLPIPSDLKSTWHGMEVVGGRHSGVKSTRKQIETAFKDYFISRFNGKFPDISAVTFYDNNGNEYYAGRVRELMIMQPLNVSNPIDLFKLPDNHSAGWSHSVSAFLEICKKE